MDKMFIHAGSMTDVGCHMSDVYFYSMSMIVGVTGGIGSGKTTVCRIFESFGVPVFYADDEAKLTYTEDADVRESITRAFGDNIYKDSELNRDMLANIIFSDKTQLELVNSIVHPAVGKRFDDFQRINADAPYILKEAAILIETGGHLFCDNLVVVTADETSRTQRVTQRDGSKPEQVVDRIRNQMSDDERRGFADFVISNNDEPLIPQVNAIHQQLMQI